MQEFLRLHVGCWMLEADNDHWRVDAGGWRLTVTIGALMLAMAVTIGCWMIDADNDDWRRDAQCWR
jgi:hypothetical protein